MKNQKGITLIALIITIIVMLILVTVSITIALQTGLFDAAGDAAQGTKEARDAEEGLSSGQVELEDEDAPSDISNLGNYYVNEKEYPTD